MAFRVRQIATVKYGQLPDYLKSVKQIEEVARARGWAPSRVFIHVAGPANEIVIEQDYPDLATFQREEDAFYDDEDALRALKSGTPFVVDGTVRTELLEDLRMDFPGLD